MCCVLHISGQKLATKVNRVNDINQMISINTRVCAETR